MQLGQIFGVTTDYLLKDDIEDEEFTDNSVDSDMKRVTLAEANEYLKQIKRASLYIGIATLLCVLSPMPLILLSLLSVGGESFAIPENVAVLIGLIVLFTLVTIAVVMYVLCGFNNAPYTFIRMNIIAICLCVFSPVSLIVAAFSYSEVAIAVGLVITMSLVAVAIYLGWSFLSGDWYITWVVWPIAGVLSAVISVICNLFVEQD